MMLETSHREANPMGRLFDSPAGLLLILAVLLLFGSRKLPDAARGLGRSLRIFKAETQGLMSDNDGQSVPPAQPQQIVAAPQQVVDVTPQQVPVAQPVAQPAPVPAPAPAPAAEAVSQQPQDRPAGS
jgi:sec-independent protein translocase protein TatA